MNFVPGNTGKKKGKEPMPAGGKKTLLICGFT